MPFAELPRLIGKIDPDRLPRNINPNPVTPAKAGVQPTAPQRTTSTVPRAYLGPGLRRGDGWKARIGILSPEFPVPGIPREDRWEG